MFKKIKSRKRSFFPKGKRTPDDKKHGAKSYSLKIVEPNKGPDFPKSIPDVYINPEDAWESILRIRDCESIYLNQTIQQKLGLEIGVNVTEEFPWKTVESRDLLRVLKEEELLDNWIDKIPIDLESVLFSYAPILVGHRKGREEHGDPFIFFKSAGAANRAKQLIKEIEFFDSNLIDKNFDKKVNPWKSQGSQMKNLQQCERQSYDVTEYQALIETRLKFRKTVQFTEKSASEQYVSLEPNREKISVNATRKLFEACFQCSPGIKDQCLQAGSMYPRNSCTQYEYTKQDESDGLDSSSDEEEESKKRVQTMKNKNQKNEVPENPAKKFKLSNNVNCLLDILENSGINEYKFSYSFHYGTFGANPYSNYSLGRVATNFVNLRKSQHRLITSVDWFPNLSGVVAISYAFSTPCLRVPINQSTDLAKRSVTEPSPVLIWSYEDPLKYKFDLTTTREIICLSFCPYDGNVLIGGTINGQIVIWDLQDRITKKVKENILTINQQRYQEIFKNHLHWMKPLNQAKTILHAAISSLKDSHTKAITEIHWLSRKCHITETGLILQDTTPKNRYFVTTSIDGTISFWNLDADVDRRSTVYEFRKNMPTILQQNESPFKKYDRIMKPLYTFKCAQSIIGNVFCGSKFQYKIQRQNDSNLKDAPPNIPLIEQDEDNLIKPEIIAGSFTGEIIQFEWNGGVRESVLRERKEEIISNANCLANVHNGPIYKMQSNPFLDEVFVTIGGSIFAIWKKYTRTPMMWRTRPGMLTHVQWSIHRPMVLFLTREDGFVEIWDLLLHASKPVFMEPIAGGFVTIVNEDRSPIPNKYFGIADYNSAFKIAQVPDIIYQNLRPDEITVFQDHHTEFSKKRKLRIEHEEEWYEMNKNLLEQRKKDEEKELQFENLEDVEVVAESPPSEQPKQRKQFDIERLNTEWDKRMLEAYTKMMYERMPFDRDAIREQASLERENILYKKEVADAVKAEYNRTDKFEPRGTTIGLDNEREIRITTLANISVEGSWSYDDLEKDFYKYTPNIDALLDGSTFSGVRKMAEIRKQKISGMQNINQMRTEVYSSMRDNNFTDCHVTLSNINF